MTNANYNSLLNEIYIKDKNFKLEMKNTISYKKNGTMPVAKISIIYNEDDYRDIKNYNNTFINDSKVINEFNKLYDLSIKFKKSKI